jgi:hypothetical protein
MSEKPGKLVPAIYGGVIIGVISGIPFLNFINCLCCAGVLLGGFLAVFFYKSELSEQTPLTTGDALSVGVLAGVFGAMISTLISALLIYTVGNLAGEAMYDLVEGLYDKMGVLEQMSADQLEQLETMKASELSLVSILSAFIIYPLFGLLGGLIGYAVYKPKPGSPPSMPTVSPA